MDEREPATNLIVRLETRTGYPVIRGKVSATMLLVDQHEGTTGIRLRLTFIGGDDTTDAVAKVKAEALRALNELRAQVEAMK